MAKARTPAPAKTWLVGVDLPRVDIGNERKVLRPRPPVAELRVPEGQVLRYPPPPTGKFCSPTIRNVVK